MNSSNKQFKIAGIVAILAILVGGVVFLEKKSVEYRENIPPKYASDRSEDSDSIYVGEVAIPSSSRDEYIRATNLKNDGRLDDSLRIFERLLKHDETRQAVLINMANIYSEKEDFAKALELRKEALLLDESDLLVQLSMASSFQELQDYEKMLEHAQKAHEIDRNSVDAYYDLAVAHDMLGNNEAAVENAEEALRLLDGETSYLDTVLHYIIDKNKQIIK